MTARPLSSECKTSGSRVPAGASSCVNRQDCTGVHLTGPPIDSNAPMALAVDRYELGAVGTNCYVVRAARGAPEAVVVDPGGDATQLRLDLARSGARCTAILITHGHYDHLGGVADLAEGTGAPVYMAEDERMLLEEPDQFTPPGYRIRPYTPDVLLGGDETLELAGIEVQTLRLPGHSPAP